MANKGLQNFAENPKCWQHWTKLCLGCPCYASVAQACFSGGVAQVMPRNKKLGLSAAASTLKYTMDPETCTFPRIAIFQVGVDSWLC